jgi:hypothetical protein
MDRFSIILKKPIRNHVRKKKKLSRRKPDRDQFDRLAFAISLLKQEIKHQEVKRV